MQPATILLADLPPLLEDMVSNVLKGHFDLHIVRGTKSGCTLLNEAVEAGARVLVVAQDNPSDLSCIDPCLVNATQVSVVAIALDGASARLHAFQAVGRSFEDVSAEQIVAAIAGAAGIA